MVYYYWLDWAADNSIGKTYPQVVDSMNCWGHDVPTVEIGSLKYGVVDQMHRSVDCAVLNDQSMLTDFLSHSYGPEKIILSNRAVQIMGILESKQADIYATTILHRQHGHQYSVGVFSDDAIDKVVFSGSSFFFIDDLSIGDHVSDPAMMHGSAVFADKQAFLTRWKNDAWKYVIIPSRLRLDHHVFPGVMYFREFGCRFLVSESIRNSLISGQLSGYDVGKMTNIRVEVFR